MDCFNCKKQIPDDSEFCVFCGEKIEKKLIDGIVTEKQIDAIKKQNFNQINIIKKKNISVTLLSIFISFFVIAVIILSIFLSQNINMLEDNKKLISELKSENQKLFDQILTINSDFNKLDNDYNKLSNDYDTLQLKYNILVELLLALGK